MDDDALLAEFIGSFPTLADLCEHREIDPVAWDFRLGRADKYGRYRWRPRKITTSASSLARLYRKLPARFPRLYETLTLSYRWAEVDLGNFRLLANPRSPGLAGLEAEILRDQGLVEDLLQAGYIPFGKGPDVNYDPVCFDTRRNPGSQDAPVVQLDHEEIPCNRKLRVVAELAPSFRALVRDVIERAMSNVGCLSAASNSGRL